MTDETPPDPTGSSSSGGEHLRTDHLTDDLSGRSVRGGSVTLLSQGGKFALQTVATVVLARLLVPEDFGLFAMVMVAVAFASLFKDLGLSWATVQSKDVSQAQSSAIFWINTGVSSLLAALLVLLAPLVSAAYDEPRLTGMLAWLALVFVCSGLSAQHLALLRRQMRYGTIAAIEVAGMFAGAAAGIGAAMAGAGYWALVIQQIVAAGTVAIMCWSFSGWKPNRPARAVGLRPLLSFGGYLTAFNVLNYFTRQGDKAILGWFVGPIALGFYYKAYNIFQMPIKQVNAPLTAVAMPVLSRLQDDPMQYRRYYYQACVVIAYMTVPAIAFLIATAEAIIPLVLGEQWLPAAPILQFMAVGGLLIPLLWTAGWVHQSLGRANRMLRWSLISDPIYVASFVIGVRWGASGVAAAFSLALIMLFLPTMWYAYRGAPVSVTGLLKAVFRPAAVAVVVYSVAVSVLLVLDTEALLLPILLAGLAALVATTLLTACWPGLRREMRGLAGLSRHLRKPT